MAEQKHTPGPWEQGGKFGVPVNRMVVVAAGINVARCFCPGGPIGGNSLAPSLEAAEANARLIAKAPDLLAECKDHGILKNPYGTFPNALRNLADDLAQGKIGPWNVEAYIQWLRTKAAAIEAIIAKAEE